MPEAVKDKQTTTKKCQHPACKCDASDGKCCGEFCDKVESSESSLTCGCGHVICDSTAQMGNEGSFTSIG